MGTTNDLLVSSGRGEDGARDVEQAHNEGDKPIGGEHGECEFIVAAWLHYRTVDVSTVKELALRWYPQVFEAAPMKNGDHRCHLRLSCTWRQREILKMWKERSRQLLDNLMNMYLKL